jgi:hypothetical protein
MQEAYFNPFAILTFRGRLKKSMTSLSVSYVSQLRLPYPARRLPPALYKASKRTPEQHIRPEDGKFNICRNVG